MSTLRMGDRVTLEAPTGAAYRCQLRGRQVGGVYAFGGGDIPHNGTLWVRDDAGYGVTLGWFDDADVVQLVPAA